MAHACAALLLLGSAPGGLAQRRRQQPRPRASAPAARPAATPAAAPAPSPDATQAPAPAATPPPGTQQARRAEPDLSFDEMLAADAYTVYAEL
ncbi:MAG TPA: hypothetical protein VF611_10435, partial [Pyrinomonadaceae bacterium]